MVTSCFCGRILKPSIRDKKSRFFLRFQLNNMVDINPTRIGRQEFIRFHNGKGCILPLLPRGRKGALFGVRQHDAALLLRDTSRGFLPNFRLVAFKNKPTARDMSRNSKAATCRCTPKGRFLFSIECRFGVSNSKEKPPSQTGVWLGGSVFRENPERCYFRAFLISSTS